MTEKSYVYDRRPGLIRRMIYDDDNPDFCTVQTTQNLESVVEANKIIREHQKEHPNEHYRIIARGVPLSVYEQSVREQWDERDWDRWINNPDNAAFKVG